MVILLLKNLIRLFYISYQDQASLAGQIELVIYMTVPAGVWQSCQPCKILDLSQAMGEVLVRMSRKIGWRNVFSRLVFLYSDAFVAFWRFYGNSVLHCCPCVTMALAIIAQFFWV